MIARNVEKRGRGWSRLAPGSHKQEVLYMNLEIICDGLERCMARPEVRALGSAKETPSRRLLRTDDRGVGLEGKL